MDVFWCGNNGTAVNKFTIYYTGVVVGKVKSCQINGVASKCCSWLLGCNYMGIVLDYHKGLLCLMLCTLTDALLVCFLQKTSPCLVDGTA